jgi:aromatic ring-opening dioxygenase catalytic subunit (LigB family)
MSVASLSHDLYGFAIELRKLAYTMPGGQEDPLIRLSERMVRHAEQQGVEARSAQA